MRDTQIYKDNKWLDIDFKNLKKGDKFRLFDNDELISDENNNTEFVAVSDSYFEEGVYTIDINEGDS